MQFSVPLVVYLINSSLTLSASKCYTFVLYNNNNNNNNLTFTILPFKHAMQTQRRRSLHIGKPHDQHL